MHAARAGAWDAIERCAAGARAVRGVLPTLCASGPSTNNDKPQAPRGAPLARSSHVHEDGARNCTLWRGLSSAPHVQERDTQYSNTLARHARWPYRNPASGLAVAKTTHPSLTPSPHAQGPPRGSSLSMTRPPGDESIRHMTDGSSSYSSGHGLSNECTMMPSSAHLSDGPP